LAPVLPIFLLAQHAFSAADDLLEIGLDVELVRGAIARCFELVDGELERHASPVADPIELPQEAVPTLAVIR
jgi:hypothetical protein